MYKTINTDSVYADICEMSYDDYVIFLKDPFWDFTSCLKKTSKKLSVKNNFWKLTHNKFDIEEDILWKKTNAYFVWIETFRWKRKQKKITIQKILLSEPICDFS